MPQKQPPASTAVCSPLTFAKGASTVGFGMVPDLFADTLLMLQELIVGINDINRKRLESFSRYMYMPDIRGFDIKRIGWGVPNEHLWPLKAGDGTRALKQAWISGWLVQGVR